VWVEEGQPPGLVVRRYRFEPKNMSTVFFKTTGNMVAYMEKGSTIFAKYYNENSF
jgi:hypothetical protein